MRVHFHANFSCEREIKWYSAEIFLCLSFRRIGGDGGSGGGECGDVSIDEMEGRPHKNSQWISFDSQACDFDAWIRMESDKYFTLLYCTHNYNQIE